MALSVRAGLVLLAAGPAFALRTGKRHAPPSTTAGDNFVVQRCGLSGETWSLDATGLLRSDSGLCAAAIAMPIIDGTALQLQTCDANSPAQQFGYNPSNASIVALSNPSMCINIANYDTSPGSPVWLWTCNPADCEGNCAWDAGAGATFTNVSLQNPGSALCLQDGSLVPPLPYTCAEGSPSFDLPFCDYTLPVDARVDDLLSRMDTPTKIAQFSVPASHFKYQAGLNLKEFLWDITCMRGISPGALSPNRNVTVFPHAIALAATWDAALYSAIGAATGVEGRIINVLNYNSTGGTSWQGVNCDGGPLANTVHDPRWGRVSETYGEDPFLSASMGVVATQALQAPSPDGAWLTTAQVTRHYLGYHSATDLPRGGEEYIDLFSFTDQQELPYRSFQVQGGAEGLMCAMSAFSIGDRSTWNTSLAPMIPSCVHPFLWEKVRVQWGWDGYVQSDCCDSINQMVVAHHYYPDIATATLNSIEMGLQASYGPDADIDTALAAMLTNGTLDMDLFNSRIRRTLLTRFKLGEFDIGRNPSYPHTPASIDVTQLDGPAHRQLARTATAASIVLLNNSAGLLPLSLSSGKTVAVIGPFADCSATEGGYGGPDRDTPLVCSYLHSYSGYASYVSTVLSAAREDAASSGFTVTYAQGSNLLTAYNGTNGGLDAAVALAQSADVVLLVVGLSALVEAEGRDRVTLTLPPPQQALVDAVTAVAGRRVVLVMVSAGTVDTTYSACGAALQAWYGGEEMGHGLWDVLSGRVSPTAKLPLTVYKEAYLSLIEPVAVFTMITAQGTGRTYRFLNESQSGSGPGSLIQYKFGYGLSYSRFTYSGLSVSLVSPAPGPGSDDQTPLLTVSVAVQNTGAVAAADVAQIYVSVPRIGNVSTLTGGAPIPLFNLVAFQKTSVLPPSSTITLSWTLPIRAVQTTTNNGDRLITGGVYTLYASGHAPDDQSGIAMHSNVVSLPVTIPPLQ